MILAKNLTIWSITIAFLIFYLYVHIAIGEPSSLWIYAVFFPFLLWIFYGMYVSVKERTYLNIGGNLDFLTYYPDSVYVRIWDDGNLVWDGWVESQSVTLYNWRHKSTIEIIVGDDPNFGHPSTTIFLHETYVAGGLTCIVIILNDDGTYYQQVSKE